VELMSWEQTVETLNSFLRDEIAAVEAYKQAMQRLGWSDSADELNACLLSHQRRVATLRDQILQLGGSPARTSGAWGAFHGLFGGVEAAGAVAEGDAATISALEEGEDHGLKLYLDDVSKLDQESRKRIEREVLPEQIRTHDSLSDLRLTLGD
jgi:hypothetical protein